MPTLHDKLWDSHVVDDFGGGTYLLYVDRHLVHEGSAAHAFNELHRRGATLRSPNRTIGTADHVVPTTRSAREHLTPDVKEMLAVVQRASQTYGFEFFDLEDRRQGISHIVGPELGITLPGCTLACGDSHTATHGAFGALAFGIGASEVALVLETQTVVQRRPKNFRITLAGALGSHVVAKDISLHLLRTLGVAAGRGYAIEFAGEAIAFLPLSGRLTLCNMAIEGGAKTAIIAPDELTLQYLHGRPYSPQGEQWEEGVQVWRTLKSDEDARFERECTLDVSTVGPQVTWGTSPEHVIDIGGRVPDPQDAPDDALSQSWRRAIQYTGLHAGQSLQDVSITHAFIGSCSNSRIEDLRQAANVVRGRKKAAAITAIVVPGSATVKRQAEAEGLDVVFQQAGFEWREPGCSLCLAMNGETLMEGDRCASTSNRNFEGRQGAKSRTHLMSPAMVAAAALAGHLVDVRDYV